MGVGSAYQLVELAKGLFGPLELGLSHQICMSTQLLMLLN